MTKDTTKPRQNQQLLFSFNGLLAADFRGGEISSDGGLLLLREFDKKTSYLKGLNQRIYDPRNQYLIIHEQEELLRQRIFQIILGYEDADDSDLLRHDPLFQISVKNKEAEELASQPTISRLENRITEKEIAAINNFLAENYIKSRKEPPKNIIVDVDSTDDPTYGKQQMSMFHGYYEQTMYHPLLISEASSQLLLGAYLRPGNVHTADNAIEHISAVIENLKGAFPKAEIILRADSGFSSPEMYLFCEKEHLRFSIGIASNSILKKAIQKTLTKARKKFKQNQQEPVCLYYSFYYRAKSWNKKRRITAKIEITKHAEDIRFIVTNMKGRAKALYEFYTKRGESENRIKEVKDGFKADRLSCCDFFANYFRLLLHACAYNFTALFRSNLQKTKLAGSQAQTLRFNLFKVGVWIEKTTRKIWAHFSSAWPFQRLFREAYLAIRGAPAYSLA